MDVQQHQRERVTTKEFSTKFKSKREIYRFLTVDLAIYLPGLECVTTYFLKDLAQGVKKCK
jgi:hypothetical protein